MPHLTLQYTSDLPATVASTDLLFRFHRILTETGGIRIQNCKSRAVAFDTYFVGDGESDTSFVHLDVTFLEGRSLSLKENLGEALLQVLKEVYIPVNRTVQITVEIRDIRKATYFKHPPGTI